MKRRLLTLLVVASPLAACGTENPDLVVERQPSPIEQASDTGWKRGSVILAGEPGTFTFPQAVSLRFTVVDNAAAEMPKALLVSQGKVEPFGTVQLEVSVAATCQPMECTGELSVTAAGTSMVAIEATGPNGVERACFYYAVVDADTDTDALRADLEAQQQDCRFMAK